MTVPYKLRLLCMQPSEVHACLHSIICLAFVVKIFQRGVGKGLPSENSGCLLLTLTHCCAHGQEPELAQRVYAIYSYGQPRVGDAVFRDTFCAAYGDRTWRLRNAGDIVPFLLPRWLGYR